MSVYSYMFGSDVLTRDGEGLELFCDDELIAEVFRSDRDKQLQISLYKRDLSLDLIEELITKAKRELGPFQTEY